MVNIEHNVTRRAAVNTLRLTAVLACFDCFRAVFDRHVSGEFSTISCEFSDGSRHGATRAIAVLSRVSTRSVDLWPADRPLRTQATIVGGRCCLFTITSLLIVVAPNIESFILLRLLQAIGGCAGMIVSRAIISDLFDGQEAARVLSLMMLVQGLGPILAPVMGGYVVAVAGWQAVFLFLAMFGAGLLRSDKAWHSGERCHLINGSRPGLPKSWLSGSESCGRQASSSRHSPVASPSPTCSPSSVAPPLFTWSCMVLARGSTAGCLA